MERDYAYYLSGRNIAIVRENTEGFYKSPDEAITNGIKMEYNAQPTAITSETDGSGNAISIDCDEELAIALVDYVKAKFAENQNQYDKMAYHMAEFKKKVYRYQNKKFGGARIMIPVGSHAIR